jgi:hypothetical protein
MNLIEEGTRPARPPIADNLLDKKDGIRGIVFGVGLTLVQALGKILTDHGLRVSTKKAVAAGEAIYRR